ncbi:AbfB domain-containing protein [Actinoplanes sp. NPDC049599]|uniref:AbfB domain-containing protein n=1 Tax=Actinoplanes sp. NPDC049599 TaxID=3363903 RepID=UPI0037A436FA
MSLAFRRFFPEYGRALLFWRGRDDGRHPGDRHFMSYQQPGSPRRSSSRPGWSPGPPSGPTVIAAGAALAMVAMALVIVIDRRSDGTGQDHSARAWIAPPTVQQWPVPIPVQSAPPSALPSLSPLPTVKAAGSPLPVARHSSPSGTPSRTAVRLLPAPGSRLSLVVTGSPNVRLRHQNFRMRLDPIGPRSPAPAPADATFVLHRGLADRQCASLEAVNFPGWFVRHQQFELVLQPRESSRQFAADATFCPQRVGSGADFLLRAGNLPDRYVTADGSRLLLGRRPPATAQSFRAGPGL